MPMRPPTAAEGWSEPVRISARAGSGATAGTPQLERKSFSEREGWRLLGFRTVCLCLRRLQRQQLLPLAPPQCPLTTRRRPAAPSACPQWTPCRASA